MDREDDLNDAMSVDSDEMPSDQSSSSNEAEGQRNRLTPLQTYRNGQNDISISLNVLPDQPTDLVVKVTDSVICVKGSSIERSDYGDRIQRSFTSPPDSAQESRAGIFRAIARCDPFNRMMHQSFYLRPRSSPTMEDSDEMDESQFQPLNPPEVAPMKMEIEEDEGKGSDWDQE